MADHSNIEWTEATWNIVTGCTKVSAGCDHCYIERTPPFRMSSRRFDRPGVGGTTGVTLHPDRLDMPLRWRKPRRVFVNSLADLFHDEVPDEFIAHVFATMAATPQHTYQVLTKRPARMRSLVSGHDGSGHRLLEATQDEATARALYDAPWPLPNVWLGVSVENQQWADIRIPLLLDTPAAVRWLSCEPLLGPVDLTNVAPGTVYRDCGFKALDGDPRIDWVVVGGESGPGARPMHPDWARSLRDQCQHAWVPLFFKQWGNWVAPSQMPEDTFMSWDVEHGNDLYDWDNPWRFGKKACGRLLDGRTWDEYPQPRPQVVA